MRVIGEIVRTLSAAVMEVAAAEVIRYLVSAGVVAAVAGLVFPPGRMVLYGAAGFAFGAGITFVVCALWSRWRGHESGKFGIRRLAILDAPRNAQRAAAKRELSVTVISEDDPVSVKVETLSRRLTIEVGQSPARAAGPHRLSALTRDSALRRRRPAKARAKRKRRAG